MPFTRFNVGAASARTYLDAPLPPGVLAHAMVHVHNTTIQPGDLWATLYLDYEGNTVQNPYAELDSGIITTHNPLRWSGTFPIENGSRLIAVLVGAIIGDIDISWVRLTTTNIQEVGLYVRATK